MNNFSYYLPKDYIPFSDDQAGGFYCFKVQGNGIGTEEIYYIDSNGSIDTTKFIDFFDFVIKNAYSY